jgi:hypothetical protein
MTFVLSVIGRDTLWVVADRRLSYDDGRHPDDDAVKIMVLETTDGRGLLAYAGLGATPKGTQPSEWMSAVLRGRGGMTFDQALDALSDAATRELPKHLALLPGGGHFIVVPAFGRVSEPGSTPSRTWSTVRPGDTGTAIHIITGHCQARRVHGSAWQARAAFTFTVRAGPGGEI